MSNTRCTSKVVQGSCIQDIWGNAQTCMSLQHVVTDGLRAYVDAAAAAQPATLRALHLDRLQVNEDAQAAELASYGYDGIDIADALGRNDHNPEAALSQLYSALTGRDSTSTNCSRRSACFNQILLAILWAAGHITAPPNSMILYWGNDPPLTKC